VVGKKPAKRKRRGRMPPELVGQEKTPEQAREDRKRFEKDFAYAFRKRDEWRRKHPNCWIAVYEEQEVAIADSRDRLLKELKRQKLPANRIVIEFVSDTPTAVVL
jgi:hypothetical protein